MENRDGTKFVEKHEESIFDNLCENVTFVSSIIVIFIAMQLKCLPLM